MPLQRIWTSSASGHVWCLDGPYRIIDYIKPDEVEVLAGIHATRQIPPDDWRPDDIQRGKRYLTHCTAPSGRIRAELSSLSANNTVRNTLLIVGTTRRPLAKPGSPSPGSLQGLHFNVSVETATHS